MPSERSAPSQSRAPAPPDDCDVALTLERMQALAALAVNAAAWRWVTGMLAYVPGDTKPRPVMVEGRGPYLLRGDGFAPFAGGELPDLRFGGTRGALLEVVRGLHPGAPLHVLRAPGRGWGLYTWTSGDAPAEVPLSGLPGLWGADAGALRHEAYALVAALMVLGPTRAAPSGAPLTSR